MQDKKLWKKQLRKRAEDRMNALVKEERKLERMSRRDRRIEKRRQRRMRKMDEEIENYLYDGAGKERDAFDKMMDRKYYDRPMYINPWNHLKYTLSGPEPTRKKEYPFNRRKFVTGYDTEPSVVHKSWFKNVPKK